MAIDLNLEVLRTSLADPLGLPEPSIQDLSGLREQVCALAVGAYRDADPKALAEAEALLYTIHVTNSFSAPVQPIPATIWGVLIRAKLDQALNQFGGCEDLGSTSEMTDRLLGAVEEWGAHNHPFLDVMAGDEGDRALIVFTKNWYGSTYGFSQELSALAQRCDREAKAVVIENINDELSGDTHDTLRARFFHRVGLQFDPGRELDDPDRSTESFALLNFRAGLCALNNPLLALGCFYTMEANWPPECKRHIKNLRGRGYDDESLEYWSDHATTDEDHSAEWLKLLEKICTTGRQRALVVDGAVTHLRVRHVMYDAMMSSFNSASASH